jgi:predicted Zn-dependent protease
MATRYRVDLKITRLLLQIGLIRARQGGYDEAQRIIRAVKAFRADLPHPGVTLGLTLLYQGRMQEAQQELIDVLAAFPSHQLARALLGLVYRESGRGDWQSTLREVIEDGRDEWAVGLARACLKNAGAAQTSDIPHAQRL